MKQKTTEEKIISSLLEKSLLKQKLFIKLKNDFELLKSVCDSISKKLNNKITKETKLLKIESKYRGEFQHELRIAGDVLLFSMHTNIFTFPPSNYILKKSYLSNNPDKAYFGIINIYNFLNDSLKYNRQNDLGYLIARIFVNIDNHFFVEGKRQLGFLYNDLESNTFTKTNIKNVIESAILYTLNFELFTPDYELVKEITLLEIQEANKQMKIRTGKRLGFQFKADTDN